MKVCIIGTGYVGLVSGACLAETGHEVTCVDIDPDKVDRVNRGISPIYEEGLDEILARNVGNRLRATTSLEEAFLDADVALICVGTPFDGKSIDLRYVLDAAGQLGALLKKKEKYSVVAVKSTVVPGTTAGPVREALEAASGKQAGADFGLGMNPEFLAEGVAVRDFMNPDRIVVGATDARGVDHLAGLYAGFNGVPLIRTNPSTAEMIKYASNSLLATLISFSNEIAGFCEVTADVDVCDVLKGVHEMKHLNTVDKENQRHLVSAASFLWAGCGFGGSCFPKDVKALIAQSEARGADTRLLSSVIAINQDQPMRLIERLEAHIPDLTGKSIGVLGLAFKPGTDDVRESPALRVVEELLQRKAHVVCHDPIASENFGRALADRNVALTDVVFEEGLDRVVESCEALILVTSWPEYADLEEGLRAGKRQPLIVDGRRMLQRSGWARYEGIGLAQAGSGKQSAPKGYNPVHIAG